MQLESISPSLIGRYDKVYRFIVAYENRLQTFKEHNTGGNDYLYIAKKIRTLKKVYKRFSTKVVDRIYQIVREDFKRFPRTTKEHLIRLGISKPKYYNDKHNFQNKFMVMVEKSTRKSAAENWKFRLSQEVEEAHEKGWFMVFDTLTGDDERIDKIFHKGSTAWRNYIQRIKRKCKHHISYFAVKEVGKKHGRPHIHVLHFFEKLPPEVVDPNLCRKVPNNRIIKYFEQFWEHGYAYPLAVRYGNDDAYAKAGWRWPCDKDKKPYDGKGHEGVSGYVCKYITKTANKKESKWRIKATRGIGLSRIRRKIKSFKDMELLAMTRLGPNIILKINKKSLPGQVLKQVAVKELVKRCNHRPSLRKFLITQKRRPSLCKLLRSLTQKTIIRSSQNSGNYRKTSLISELYKRQNVVHSDRFYQLMREIEHRFAEKQRVRQYNRTGSLIQLM